MEIVTDRVKLNQCTKLFWDNIETAIPGGILKWRNS